MSPRRCAIDRLDARALALNDRVIPLDGGEVLLGGWYVTAVTSLVELRARSAGRNGVHGGQLFELLEGLRVACSNGSAAQPLVAPDVDGPASWPWSDPIDVKEAARIMNCTKTNVRTRSRRGTVLAKRLEPGGVWVLSRADIEAHARRKAS